MRFLASSIVTVNLPAVGTYRSEKQMSPNLPSYITIDIYQKTKFIFNKHTKSRLLGGGINSFISLITFPKSTVCNGICTSPIRSCREKRSKSKTANTSVLPPISP